MPRRKIQKFDSKGRPVRKTEFDKSRKCYIDGEDDGRNDVVRKNRDGSYDAAVIDFENDCMDEDSDKKNHPKDKATCKMDQTSDLGDPLYGDAPPESPRIAQLRGLMVDLLTEGQWSHFYDHLGLNKGFAEIAAEESAQLGKWVTRQTIQSHWNKIIAKVSYFDLVLSCPDAQPITIIAKDYGWSANKMNKFLHEQGVQYKIQKTWVLYSNHAGQGYTKTETVPYTDQNGIVHNATHTKWTQKGRLFIYDLMKTAGNIPFVEQEN